MRRAAAGAVALLLAGCGGGATEAIGNAAVTRTSTDPDGTTHVMAGNTAAAIALADCARADHAPIRPDAVIRTCSTDPQGERRGTVIYETAAAPADLLAWSRDRGLAAGLRPQHANDMAITMGADDRTLMVMAMPNGSGSQVTVNWGR